VQYTAYGEVYLDSNPEFQLVVGFHGGLYDPLTKLVHFTQRDYDVLAGRWTSPDYSIWHKIGKDPAPFNLYMFKNNNPLSDMLDVKNYVTGRLLTYTSCCSCWILLDDYFGIYSLKIRFQISQVLLEIFQKRDTDKRVVFVQWKQVKLYLRLDTVSDRQCSGETMKHVLQMTQLLKAVQNNGWVTETNTFCFLWQKSEFINLRICLKRSRTSRGYIPADHFYVLPYDCLAECL